MTVFNSKLLKLLAAMAVLLPAPLAVAAEGEGGDSGPVMMEDVVVYSQMPEARDYQYGMRLDIAEVVDMEYFPPEPDFCGVIPAQMTYEDSMGELRAIRYLYPDTSGCSE